MGKFNGLLKILVIPIRRVLPTPVDFSLRVFFASASSSMYLISLLPIFNLGRESVSSLGSTRNLVTSFYFVNKLCRKLGKSILHGPQNPDIFLAMHFTSTNRGNKYERKNYMRVLRICGFQFKSALLAM